MANIIELGQQLAILLGLFLAAWGIERRKPVQRRALGAERFNFPCIVPYVAAHSLLGPGTAAMAVSVVNAMGGGWLVLADARWALVPAFLLYALTQDGLEYGFHRAQHQCAGLWAMHSLHHSETAMAASTTFRHFWAEQLLKTMSIYLILGIVFKANSAILGMSALLSYYNIFPHMNLRVGFGRWAAWLNSPQYHRIHHSSLPHHEGRNFAALFPVFDVIFGTFLAPDKDSYPPTGLADGAAPAGLFDALCWPARGALKRVLLRSRP
ncbi:MAG: sterol desaturase family protein [Pseudomonadota bacterium]